MLGYWCLALGFSQNRFSNLIVTYLYEFVGIYKH